MSSLDTAEVLVVVFAAVALGLSAFAVWIAWSARGTARQALGGLRVLAARSPRPKAPSPPPPPERRDENFGPPTGQPERRRHRAPEDTRARRRDVDDPQWSTARPPGPDEQPETAEHAPPTTAMGAVRRIPPPGQIG